MAARGGRRSAMNHGKKIIAPVVVTILSFIYFAGFAFLFLSETGLPAFIRVVMGITYFAFTALMAGVLISRIREIQGGEEDDLSKY
jgi:hypothetical protein